MVPDISDICQGKLSVFLVHLEWAKQVLVGLADVAEIKVATVSVSLSQLNYINQFNGNICGNLLNH